MVLTKHKLWLGAGVIATAVGVVAGQRGDVRLWPADRALHESTIGESGEAGKSGVVVGAASPLLESGEAGERPATAPTEGGEAGEHGGTAELPVARDFAGGSFDVALREVLGGEGGKDGLGISPLALTNEGWSFSVPVLTGAQVAKAMSGNSLRSERHFALHFQPDGRYRGWSLNWSKGRSDQCPSKSGPNYGLFDGECWVATDNALVGSWTVKGDALCLAPAPSGVTYGRECVRGALMLNSLVLFGPDGRMIGKGAELLPGDDASRERRS